MNQHVEMIAAVADNHTIGTDNDLPWGSLRDDMIHFRKYTKGRPVIMGSKTARSLTRALPGRKNIVLTRNQFRGDGFHSVSTPEEALEVAQKAKREMGWHGKTMIIGGEEIYRLFMDLAETIYLTRIERNFEGDAFFPELDDQWDEEPIGTPAETEDGLRYHFVKLSRRVRPQGAS